MSANKIAETSASTGTGNITLAGAWSVPSSFINGNRTFNEFYGLSHRFPYMIQDQLGNWEKGVAYLSDATTLVREMVTDNSANTTALINFPAGEKLVMVPTDVGLEILPKIRPNAAYGGSALISNNTTNAAMAADRFILVPVLLKRPMEITQVGLDIATAVASSTTRMGLYQFTNVTTTYSFSLMQDIGTIDSSISGFAYKPLNKILGAGIYFFGVVSSGAIAIRGLSQMLDLALCFSNNSVNGQGWIRNGFTGAVAAMPATLSLTTGEMNANLSVPRFHLIGRLL